MVTAVVVESAVEKRLERNYRARGDEWLKRFIASTVVLRYMSGAVQNMEQIARRPNSTVTAPRIA
jgi:hypothetical protein